MRKKENGRSIKQHRKLKMLKPISSGSLAGLGRYHITTNIKDIAKDDRMANKLKYQGKGEEPQAEAATYFTSVTEFKNKFHKDQGSQKKTGTASTRSI
jgi:hypothetical protein